MKDQELRTSLFSFDPNQLAPAYRVQIGPDYLSAWNVLQSLSKKTYSNLPTNALEEMLSALSKGPVKVAYKPYFDSGNAAILMLFPLPVELINQVLQLWAMEIMRRHDAVAEGLESKLIVTDVVPLSAQSLLKPGKISPLAYPTIPWRIALEMRNTPLQVQRPATSTEVAGAKRDVRLHLTSDSSLVTWDDPVIATSKAGEYLCSSLHVIEPKLVLLRDREEPFIQLRVHMSHLMPSWIGKKRHAWVDAGGIIVHAGVKSIPKDGGFRNIYEFPSDDLLKFLPGSNHLPTLNEGSIGVDSPFRPYHAVMPSNPKIGSGPGSLFFDMASFHLLACLPGSAQLKVKKAVSSLKSPPPNSQNAVAEIRVAVLSAHTQTLLRLTEASKTLGSMPFFKKIAPPAIALHRIEAPDSQTMLHGDHGLDELKRWLLQHIIPALKQSGLSVAIVETSVEAAAKADNDPKHFIRRILAEQGIATQFIMRLPPNTEVQSPKDEEEDNRDFKALNAVTEAIRLFGYFPTLFPRSKNVPEDTTVQSVFLDRITEAGAEKFLPVITRVIAGGTKTDIFWFDHPQSQQGRWLPFTEGVCAIHAWPGLLDKSQTTRLIDQSMLASTPSAHSPLIVCLHSLLRSLYGGLKDSPGSGLPPVPTGAAIIRVRADRDVAQITGDQVSHPDGPFFIGRKLGLFQSMTSDSVYYFISPSKVFMTSRSHRYNSRYDITSPTLKEPWHLLGVTEITLIRPSSFAGNTAIAEQIAILCRNAPMWDGHLRRPSPMHLAAQIAGDHPILELRRKSDANREAEDLVLS